MRFADSRRTLKILALGLLVTMAGTVVLSGHASAIPTRSPDYDNVGKDDGTTAPTPYRLAHIVSKADYNRVPSTELRIYASNPDIGIAILSADVCDNDQKLFRIQDVRNNGMQDVDNGDQLTTFTLSAIGGVTAQEFGYKKDPTTCANDASRQFFPNVGTNYGQESLAVTSRILRIHSNEVVSTAQGTLYKFSLKARWDGDGQCTAGLNCGVNSFMVQALNMSGNTYVNGAIFISQKADASADARNFGLNGIGNDPSLSDNSDGNHFYNYNVSFGTDCTLDAGESKATRLQIYDDDNYNGPGAQKADEPFGIRLEKQDKNGGGWQDVNFDLNGSTGTNDDDVVSDQPGGMPRKYKQGNFYYLGTDSNKAGAPWTINMKFVAQGNFRYKVSVKHVDVHNNLQFAYPYETVWSDRTCTGSPQQYVTLHPVITTSASDYAETGEPITFTQGVTVDNFPVKIKDWGYNERAEQNAKDDNVYAQQTDYPAQRDGVNPDGTATRKCKSGWATSCGTYECANGALRDGSCGASVGYYKWRCERSGLANSGQTTGQNAPSCNVVELRCKNSSGDLVNPGNGDLVWANDANAMDLNNYCHNKWVCPAGYPGGTYNTRDDYLSWQSATQNPNYLCRYFSCQNTNDPQHFFTNNGNQPKDRCDYRCSDAGGTPGKGEHALLASNNDGRWGTGDQKCYIAPSFQIHCSWDGGVSTTDETVNSGNYTGLFCQGQANTTTVRTSISSHPICPGGSGVYAQTTPVWSAWSSPPPGKGNADNGGNDFATMRTTWTILADPPFAESCVRPGLKPYFHVFNGDVNANATFSPCGSASTGRIQAFNAGAAGGFKGSGAQLAAFAAGVIDGFSSNSQGVTKPQGLTFANTNPGLPWGGNLQVTSCIPDDAWTDNTFQNGNISVSGHEVSGVEELYVNGDVYINGSITYPASFGITNVPTFKVVSTGNIYISSAVSTLSGILMTKGNVYTCAVSAGGQLVAPTPDEMKSQCSNTLKVNGSVMANNIKLLRVGGSTVSGALANSTDGAETFIYSPEAWIKNLSAGGGGGFGYDTKYDSITNLPPVL